MLDHSKILIWYEISSQRVSLGEVMGSHGRDIGELWRSTPIEILTSSEGLGYRMSLIGNNGRKIGDKAISMSSADSLLIKNDCGLAAIGS